MPTPAQDADLPVGKGMSDENFPVGSRLIAPEHRRHVHAYYAFVRAADDVSDSPDLAPAEKLRRLDLMERALRGDPDAHSSSAGPLRATLAATGLAPEYATDLLVAFRRDATTLRTPDWAALLDYCRYSANPVGRFLLALHGEDAITHGPSDALCTSLQILNHLQDCADDFRALDRSYLPADFLDAEGITPDLVLADRTGPALGRVFARILDRVDGLNAEAASLPGLVADRRMRLECAVIVGVAHRLARRLRRGDPLATRVELGPSDLAFGLAATLRHVRRPGAGLSALGCARADLAAVQKIVDDAGTSFGRGMRILPPDRRAAMHAIYAFCRVVDDIADDEAAPIAGRRAELDAWHARIEAMFAGDASEPLTRVLLAATRRYALRRADFQAVIDGMLTDAANCVVAPTAAALDLYCDQVASAVGRLSVRAFGDGSASADRVSLHLGRALQLTNILRDLDEDRARGRLYLPREYLDEAGVPHAPDAALAHPAIAIVCARVAGDAARHFRAAEVAMARCDRTAMRPARIMAATYAALLDGLERRGWRDGVWRDPHGRVSVPKWRKIAIAVDAMVRR